jgi:HTH-type transcriptional regulator/antitoxin HipB
MSVLKKYTDKRKKDDVDFARDFNSGYEELKIGEMLKQARVEVGLTQNHSPLRMNLHFSKK